jgi:hypothetical protein
MTWAKLSRRERAEAVRFLRRYYGPARARELARGAGYMKLGQSIYMDEGNFAVKLGDRK